MTRQTYELIFMDKEILNYLRAWPDCFWPAYDRVLYDARILATPPNVITAKNAALTNLGVRLKAAVDDRSFNYFSTSETLDFWPVELLANRRDDATAFLALFGLDWNDAEVRRYISDRMTNKLKRLPPNALGRVQFDDWLGLADVPYVPLTGGGLLGAMARLGEAVDDMRKSFP